MHIVCMQGNDQWLDHSFAKVDVINPLQNTRAKTVKTNQREEEKLSQVKCATLVCT